MTRARQLRRLAYRPADAASVCGVSERTFAQWIKSENPPPHFKRGNVVLVPRRELEKWLTEQLQTD